MLEKLNRSKVRKVDELARLRSKLDYWSKKDVAEQPSDTVLLFSSEIVAKVLIDNEKDVRFGTTYRTMVFRVGSLAKMINRSVQTVRLWERDGILPDSGILLVGKKRGQTMQRCYTYDQMRAVFDLLPFIDFGDHRGNEYTAFSREIWRRWMEMPDGVLPEYAADPAPPEDEIPSMPPKAKLMGKPRRKRAGS